MDGVKSKVFGNLVWRLGERYLAQIVQFVVSIVLARILLPEIYGTVALVLVFINFLQVFIDSGFGTALVQKKDADDLDFSTVFYFNIVICAVLYLIIFLFAPLIAKFYKNNDLTLIIRILSISLIFSSLKNVQQAYVSRKLQFRKFFFATLFGTIISAVVGIYMAYKGFGVWAIVTQNLTNIAFDTTLLWILVRWRPKLQFSFARLKTLFKFGWKLLVSSLISTVYTDLRQLIIGKKYSEADIAYYNKGNQFPNIIVTNINSSIDSVLFPVLAAEQDDKVRVKQMARKAIKTSVYLMAPLMIGLAVTAPSLVRLILTEKWLPCVPLMQIFCFCYLFYPIHTANLNAINAVGRSDLYLKLEIIKKIMGFALLFSSMWISVKAMAYSLLISDVLSQVINSYPNKKLLNYSYFSQLKDILPSVLLAGAMGLFVWGLSFIPINYIALLFIQIAAGAIFYIGFSAIFKIDIFLFLCGTLKGLFKRNSGNNKTADQTTIQAENQTENKLVQTSEAQNLENQIENKENHSEKIESKEENIMKVGIMQPYFFPYIGYFQLMNAVDKYVIFDDVNFIKGGWINRNRILINGEPFYFNVPTIGASSNKLINEVKVNTDKALASRNLRVISSAYSKAPHFNEVYPLIEDIVRFKEENIAKYIAHSFEVIAKYLDIKTEFIISSDLKKDNSLKCQDKVIAICKELGATEYYNAIGGQELYSFDDFRAEGIELAFVKTGDVKYKQFKNEFQPNLSIIDVMMFNSKEEIQKMLKNFTLIKGEK